GHDAPAEALDRMAVEAAPGVALLARGEAGSVDQPPPAGGAAALATALREGRAPTVADCGGARDPASSAVACAADATVVVIRGCYLALRRAIGHPVLGRTAGAVLVEEPQRSLGAREVVDVLGVPVLVRVPLRASTARAVDAGVVAARLPDS